MRGYADPRIVYEQAYIIEDLGNFLLRIVRPFVKTNENLDIFLIRHRHSDCLVIEDELGGCVPIGYTNRLLVQFGIDDLIALTDSNTDRHGDGASLELRPRDNLAGRSNVDGHGSSAVLAGAGRVGQGRLIDHARGVLIATLFICIEEGRAVAQRNRRAESAKLGFLNALIAGNGGRSQ